MTCKPPLEYCNNITGMSVEGGARTGDQRMRVRDIREGGVIDNDGFIQVHMECPLALLHIFSSSYMHLCQHYNSSIPVFVTDHTH